MESGIPPMDSPYERVLFVCTRGKTCPTQGSEAVHRAMKEAVFAGGLGDRIRVNQSGCLAQCGHGPMVIAYPEGRWYAAVTEADAAALVEAEIRGGVSLDRLRYRPARPGKNVCRPGETPGTVPPIPPSGGDGAAGP